MYAEPNDGHKPREDDDDWCYVDPEWVRQMEEDAQAALESDNAPDGSWFFE